MLSMDDVADPIAVISRERGFSFRNDQWTAFFGPPNEQAGIERISAAVHPSDLDSINVMFERALAEKVGVTAVLRVRHQDGSFHRCNVTASPVVQINGDIRDWVIRIGDLDGEVRTVRALNAGLELRDQILDAAVVVIVIMDPEGRLTYCNRVARDLMASAVGSADPLGQPWIEHLPPGEQGAGRRALKKALAGQTSQIRGRTASARGTVLWSRELSPLYDSLGRLHGVLCVSRDVTEHDNLVRRLRVASETDPLTGLLNRRTFDTRLRAMLRTAQRQGVSVGLLLIDLDHFKAANDIVGHVGGDRLLRGVARRIAASVPADALVGRLGGDEFAVALFGNFSEDDFLAVAGRIRTTVLEARTAQRLRSIGVTIGCALYPRDASDALSLTALADTVLKLQKSEARGTVRVFDPSMQRRETARAAQLDRAARALADQAIEVVYQPQIRMSDGALEGFEALLRWRDEAGALQAPAFVEAAFSDFTLATELGVMVRNRVIADIRVWREQGRDVLPVAVNVAPIELARPGFGEDLLELLKESAIPPELIEVEITEQALYERGAEIAQATLALLRGEGARVAIDDFGTGHSGLMRLASLPVDTVKIDRSFVAEVDQSKQGRAIVDAVVALARAVDCRVVAEGIETASQLDALREAGCDLGQGYYTGTVVSAEEVGQLLGRAQP